MNQIGYYNQTKETIEELKEIESFIQYATKKLKLKNAIFNIIIVDNNEIKKINKEYRNIDRETDVISFALEEGQSIDMDFRILGDIYISIDKAKSQALDYGHSFLRELAFLTIHGLLHLLGYDHMNEKDEKNMIKKQEEILNGYGIKRWTKKIRD